MSKLRIALTYIKAASPVPAYPILLPVLRNKKLIAFDAKVSQIAYLTGNTNKVRLIIMQPRQANLIKCFSISDFWRHYWNFE
jgi:hypothetical protein